MTSTLERGSALWKRLTGQPESHEGPWPEATNTWRDHIATSLLSCWIALAVSAALAAIGVPSAWRLLATVALPGPAILAYRAWRARRR